MYKVKEIFKTIQGEGYHAGTAAVFCRFAGCNLWSGKEEDRASAICQFCDTQFIGGDTYDTTGDLADAIDAEWGLNTERRFLVLTGGEPMLQLNVDFVYEMKRRGYYVAVETNGTVSGKCGVLPAIDWVCVSPKSGTKIRIQRIDEVKLVYPQYDLLPSNVLKEFPECSNFYLQPMDGNKAEYNTAATVGYCLRNPVWKVSTQVHKFLGLR